MRKVLLKTMFASLLISFIFITPVYSEQHQGLLQEEQIHEETESDIHEKMRIMMQEQEGAVAANEAMMNYFCKDGIEPNYPEYFSGRYIENNKLFVCYVGELDKVRDELDKVFGDLKIHVEYKSCKYSYHELQEYLSKVLVNLEARGCQITGYGIREKSNVAYVCVHEDSFSIANDVLYLGLRNIDERLELEKRDYLSKTVASLYGGHSLALYTGSNIIYCTLGICGTYNGQAAFITCGHDMAVGDTLYYSGLELGRLQVVQFKNNELGDFSIGLIEKTNITIPTHKIGTSSAGYTTLSGATMNHPAEGTIVSRYGYLSNLTYGEIVNTFAPGQYTNSITIRGLVEVRVINNGYTIAGDSGGPVFVNGSFLGILSGKNIETGNWLYTPYEYIRAAGFIPYASHQISAWTDYNSTHHRGYCSICMAYILEVHSSNNLGVCIRCGHLGNSVAP